MEAFSKYHPSIAVNMAHLRLTDISKFFGNTEVVSHIDLDVADGEFIVLVGPSGCGKSTLLRIIAGLERADSGEIIIDGKSVDHLQPAARNIAMVFQNYALYPHMTVFQNLAFGLQMQKTPRAEIDRRVAAVAKILKLENLLNRKSKALSGGQQQRVALGRAIVRHPTLFLFDEPLSNLDAKLRVAMRRELIKLHKKLGTTMIYVTHDQVEAMSMGDRLAVLKDGKIQQIGKPLEIYRQPATLFVAGFIGSPPINLFECKLLEKNGQLFAATESFELQVPESFNTLFREADLPEKRMILGIRPEDIMEKRGGADQPLMPYISGEVEFLEPLGSEVYAACRKDNQEFVVRLSSRTLIQADQKAEFAFDLSRAHFFHPLNGTAFSAIHN